MTILIINGPNLNLLGRRQPEIYGSQTFEDYLSLLEKRFPEHVIEYYQSNIEGELIDKLHETGFSYDGIILNAGAYTHTSIAIADAVAGINTPVVEVHISNIHAREEFRQKSLLSKNAAGMITGFGMSSYALALEYLTNYHKQK